MTEILKDRASDIRALMQVLIGAGILWIASSTSETSEAVAVLCVQMEQVKQDIGEFKAGHKDRYTGSQANAHNKEISYILKDHEKRLRDLEISSAK